MTIFGNMAGSLQVKANWNQDDPAKADYIDGKAALRQEILAEFPNARFMLEHTTALCSFYAEAGGLIIGFEGAFNAENDNGKYYH